MKIYYDREADVLYLRLREVPLGVSRDIEEGVTLDLDDDGNVIGVEVLDASERFEHASDFEELAATASYR